MMTNDIDEILFEDDTGIGSIADPALFIATPSIHTRAHPFTEDDLIAFAASGEHPGLD